MEPVRVKLYGLFSMTKRRYVFQAAASAVMAVGVLVGWYFAWAGLRPRLTRIDLPPSTFRTVIVSLMDAAPWILLAALAYQAAESYLVLRVFARKEAGRGVSPPVKQRPAG